MVHTKKSLHLFAGAGGGILGDILLGREIVGAIEIEKYPREVLLCRQADNILPHFPIWDDVITFRLDNPETKQYIEYLQSIKDDLCICGGFPCQDISSSGKQRGFEEGAGTRSSLLWECKKAIEAKKPRFLMMENVKALVSAKFMPFLRQWQTWLHQQGYENFTQVLNASDYNVPQNRERVFMISILRTDSEPNPSFYFPKKMKLERRIKDILEPNVDESFYLSDKALEYFCRVNNGLNGSDKSSCVGKVSNSQDGVVSGVNAIAPTLTAGHANQPKLFNEE